MKKFKTVITCMDGRIQRCVNDYLMTYHDADFVDTITEAGPNKILAQNKEVSIVENIKNRCDVSINLHCSDLIGIVAHFDCGGNPAIYEQQLKDLYNAKELVQSWYSDIKIILMWVDENQVVHELSN
ncbi:hypothetical protein RJG79_12315 [Mycoplasmatota bacterium WC44]